MVASRKETGEQKHSFRVWNATWWSKKDFLLLLLPALVSVLLCPKLFRFPLSYLLAPPTSRWDKDTGQQDRKGYKSGGKWERGLTCSPTSIKCSPKEGKQQRPELQRNEKSWRNHRYLLFFLKRIGLYWIVTKLDRSSTVFLPIVVFPFF